MDSEVLCESLLIWIGTFDGINGPHQTVQDLMDGVAMAECLSKIASAVFSGEWLSRIKRDANHWRLKTLKQDLSNLSLPNVEKIAINCDEEELGKMLQLILGCAFFCNNREGYIKVIMELEQSVQEVIMTAIQELMTPTSQNDQSIEEERVERLEQEIHDLAVDKKELTNKCRDLENQVANLQEELTSNKELLDRYNNVESIVNDPTTDIGFKFQNLHNKIELLQKQNLSLESERDEITTREERQEKILIELRQERLLLSKRAEEAQELRDKVDELSHTADKLAQSEAQLTNYKKKLDDAAGQRDQIKKLEDRIAGFVRDNAELKAKLEQQNSQTKFHNEYYSEKISQLKKDIEECKKIEEEAKVDLYGSREKCNKLEFENKKLIDEMKSLREINAHLSARKISGVVSLDDALGQALADNDSDAREKMIQLQTENESLRKRAEEAEKKLFIRENEHLIEKHNTQIVQQKEDDKDKIELKQAIENMQSKVDEQSSLLMKREREIQVQQENGNKNADIIKSMQTELASRDADIGRLKDQLTNNENDMIRLEDKYKKFLDKAKQLLPRNATGSPELQALQSQIQEKEYRVRDLERQIENLKTIHEREMKLVTTAWYELGLEVHKKTMNDRLASSGGDSFLARQRQGFKRH
ncbi:Protein Hook-like protein 3 [Trichoplax sp. H2]|nr:Protein Hook-like protein 3 [Trichoplax sp. H2]|eukprot:RDD46248.1 Protein Hook-like protein 3 [Trichoplax sp. H2]